MMPTISVQKNPVTVPSILEQTKWPTGFYQFPPTPIRTEYFNCSIVDWRGSDWLITRRRQEIGGKAGKNDIVFWQLQNNRPVRAFPIRIRAQYPGEHFEDPRAFVANGRVFLGYCNFMTVTFGRQCSILVNSGMQAISPFSFPFGRQGRFLGEKRLGHEKNWIWFFHDNALHFIYTFEPLRILRVQPPNKLIELVNDPVKNVPLWNYGEVRGGTPLTRIGDEYWSFFHSSTDHPQFRRRYHMGVMVQDANPPFRIKRVSRKPILSGSEQDPRNPGAPLCIFPCGSIYRNNEWLVVLGVNDHKCGWLKIPHAELEATLNANNMKARK